MTGATFTIAKLVVREVIRRRLLLALVLLTVLAVGLTAWGFSKIPEIQIRGRAADATTVTLISSQLLILVMFMFSNILALSAVFVASPSLSGDVESGIALSVLARPISRADFLIGKWLGFMFLLAVYATVAITLELVAVRIAVGYTPPEPVSFIAYLLAEGLVLLTLTMFLSARLSGMVGGVVALVLLGMSWIAGVVGGIGSVLESEVIERAGTIAKVLLPTDGLWRGAIYHLQPSTVLAGANAAGPASAANPFSAARPPDALYLAWCAFWVVVVLGMALLSFHRREI